MTPDQIRILWEAAEQAGLTADQKRSLSPINPFSASGPVADRMKSAVSRIAPIQAREWIAEAGATLSLAAMAAKQGLAPMTVDIAAEIAALDPKTAAEAAAERIAELEAMRPYGTLGSYAADGTYTPGAQGNLTAALELESLAPERAAALKAAAMPPQASHGLTAEGAAFVNARLQSMEAVQ